MAKKISDDLRKKQAAFDRLVQDEELIKKIYAEKLTEGEVSDLRELPFYFYAYDSAGAIVFWNNNKILEDCGASLNSEILFQHDRGAFIKKCIAPLYFDTSKKLVALFPIVITFPIENNYLKPYFDATDYIPLSTKVLPVKSAKQSIAVKNSKNDVLFYLNFQQNGKPVWVPDSIMLGILLAALLVSIAWLHLLTIALTRKKSYWWGFTATLIIVIGLRSCIYIWGLPFNLDQLQLFSPSLYASSVFLPSLGDLLINAICFLWIIVFTIKHVPYRLFGLQQLNILFRYILGIALIVGIVTYSSWFVSIVRSLVLDSMISFDVSHFYSISGYTIIGLFTIGIIISASCLFIYLLHVQVSDLITNKWMKYFLLLVTGILIISMGDNLAIKFSYFLLGWLFAFIVFLDVRSFTQLNDPFTPYMIFWAGFVCAFCTIILQYFNNTKELETRKRFAEQVVEQRDDVTVYTFSNLSQRIQNDKGLADFLEFPSQDKRRRINELFDNFYLTGQLNKYQARVYLFDETGNSIYNADTTSYLALHRLLESAEPTADSTLFYQENAQDGHYYLARIPVYNHRTEKIGYVFIDLAVKPAASETVYPELLQPGSIRRNQNEAGYAYAIYAHGKLITQTNDYSFPIYLSKDTLKNTFTFLEHDGISELRYKADNAKTVIVIHSHELWQESITLFSYLFGIQMLILLLILLYRFYLIYFTKPKYSGKLIELTLRRRIHFSMLTIVLMSFLIIGIVTTAFFTRQYKDSSEDKLRAAMQVVERSILQYLKDDNGFANQQAFRDVISSIKFSYLINNLATGQKIDINVFDGSGTLEVTSQDNIYDKSLLARIIRPDAYYNLYYEKKSNLIQSESIGKLSYLSGYVPIRNELGTILGYINVPFFSSEKELNYQISNILVALINIYAFIFLLSSVFTIFITSWLTKMLGVIIIQFERLNLKQNERLEWPYDDEIGMLVREYNKMIRKVEENAALLAQSERESAWREMARQVAHEITNPLTPMKLNIQYLQQALKSKKENVLQLAEKVSESLIEQINNLSYIASEFSNFAKMPEAKPEDVNVNELLDKAVELYLDEQNMKVHIHKHEGELYIHSDRSQLLRVFTNLIQNAVQAIPADRQGLIEVTTKKEDGHVTISFKDNGAGISEEVIEKIFQPYFTTKSSGTGLGLAMTKKIIEFWKGKIWFNTVYGEGTVFYISLPLVRM